MKKKTISSPYHTFVKKFVLVFSLAGALVAGSSNGAAAQDSTKKASNPSVNYIGTLDGQPVFRVQFNNQDRNIYNLTIIDDEGVLLYSEKIKDKEFSKKFKFEKSDRDNMQIRFVLSGEGERKTQVFQVDTNIQVMSDVVVTRL